MAEQKNHEQVFDPPEGLFVLFSPHTDARNPWQTTRVHSYRSTTTRSVIPSGFRCDFASVPRLLLMIFGPYARHQRAAAHHDALYRLQHSTRFEADAAFRQIMVADGVRPWKRLLLYYGVRLFGWIAWRRNTVQVGWFRERVLNEGDKI